MENKDKHVIIDRLYKSASICSVCGESKCIHTGNRELPTVLDTDDVLYALNLDEYFYKED